jgi:uncharacterized membrane protein YecN with MAPEG domain
MLHLKITLITAGFCGILFIILSALVIQIRFKSNISIGDDGNNKLHTRIRTQANFAEYVPLALILMAIIESTSGSNLWLTISGIVLVLSRIFHAIGMQMKAPNPFRIIGVLGTFALILTLSVYAIILSMTI